MKTTDTLSFSVHLCCVQVPSGNPELTRISFSWTLASQVILRVDMLRRLCSQKLFSASSPLILT